MKNQRIPELHLDVKKFEKDVCFICNQSCEGYCHASCAVAYMDEKENRLKIARGEI